MKSRSLPTLVVAIALFLLNSPAMAQNVCDVLRGQLAQAGGGNSASLLAQLGQAQANLASLQVQFQQMGCNVLFQVFAPPQCGPVRQALAQAQGQVANLQQAANRAGGQATGSRQQILAALPPTIAVPGRTPSRLTMGPFGRCAYVRPMASGSL
jgi:hypothetical protein